jgi:hypothetical protein
MEVLPRQDSARLKAMWRPVPMGDYALKIQRGAAHPQWRTGLTFEEALILISDSLLAEERKPNRRYLTATIYRNAMVVSLSRYFPAEMRRKNLSPDDLEQLRTGE